MPKIRKHTTRRVTLKKKYSIQKKIKDSKKKIKKEAKKLRANGILPRSKSAITLTMFRDKERIWHPQYLPLQGRTSQLSRAQGEHGPG
jgi:hypothetical protein